MRKKEFKFNPKIYNFWSIYEALKKHYPIGIPKDESGAYYEYSGIKELEKIITENIHDNDRYKQNWVKFTKLISTKYNKEILGTTYGQAPSFSASIIINSECSSTIVRREKINFSVSLLGNFYQIYGIDEISIEKPLDGKTYTSISTITVSPIAEYKEIFEIIEMEIKNKFPKHKIIPFSLGIQIMRGLNVRYLDEKDCSIYKGLFNHFLPEDVITNNIRGNKKYGIELWKK
jgi:hypothetical protein